MSFLLVDYIVNYDRPGRAEGGPTVTRHLLSEAQARHLIEIEKKDPETRNFRLVKQTSVVTREDLEI